MEINLSKNELLVFPPSTNSVYPNLSTSVCGVTITRKQQARCLGVVLDSDHSFECVAQSLAHSCRMHFRNISRIRPFLTLETC
ncbi:hypothetical protein GDO81_020314 [Engystomops pustulosus]|uniref:Uncharacterized protein n=1 Tax=Engystomops pustulosus TaxID=76066 RepID=A0AAV6YRS6_ENGPU|nr:hypothetical protein GDO81_020314 [Engystomops pustulosus]